MARKIAFEVGGGHFCEGCATGVRRFLGHMKGVEDVSVEKGRLVISFDGDETDEGELLRVSRESMEKLGYKIEKE
jgi:copper chaperone CopZ